MKKNQKNVMIRLDAPTGRLGVPPDASIPEAGNNILLIAKLTDWQLNALLNIINDRQDHAIRH